MNRISVSQDFSGLFMNTDTDIVILGAGLSGLAAADALSAAGKRVLVLEKEQSAGGLARTISYKNFRFDLGGHRLYFKDAALAASVENLLKPEPLLRLKRRSSTFIGGRFLRYPPTLLNGILYAAPALIKRLRRAGPKPPDGSLRDWLHARFGPGIHDAYFRDYTLKVWGLPTDNISAAWAERRIGPMNLKKLFFEMFSVKSASKENILDFLYPREGIGGLCSALLKKLPSGALLTGATPVEFETDR
ncbi:MAG: NAD(P)-binding protein, partial [Elusimicrobiota bacterium]